ncbi:MAG: putative alpha/beta superfamily hydrolase [Rhodothermales bacterium]|jgi:predicted alpha/beta superfamily hydrolase
MIKTFLCFPLVVLTFASTYSALAQSPSQPAYLFQAGVPDSLYSEVLQEQRHIWVHLPNGGNLREGDRYPVTYLMDGGVHLGALAALQEYYGLGKIPEMIVVGISNRTNRTRDLTTSEVETRRDNVVPESGGAEQLTRFMEEELMPYIDGLYPTSMHRTLIGHSYAGLFTVNMLVNHRELFTNYIAIDPSLDWDDQRMLKEATAALAEEDFHGKGLYVSLANEFRRFTETLTVDDVMYDTTEFSLGIRSTLEFVHTAEAKKSNGLRFAWRYYEKDSHWSVPLVSMRDGLTFLFDWWELETPSRYNNPETPVEDIVTLIRARTESLTRNLGYPAAMEEELLGMLGQMSMDSGQPAKAQAVLELTAEFYPESASAHDALTDFFVAQEDFEKALVHAKRAFAISGSEAHRQRVEELSRQN